MKRPGEEEQFLAASGLDGQLDRSLNRLGATIAEERALQVARCPFGDQLCQLGLNGIDKVAKGIAVDDLAGLFVDRFNHLGVRMSGCRHGDPPNEVEILTTLGSLQDAPLSLYSQYALGARK